MDTKNFTINNYYPRAVPIDDGVEATANASLPLRIRRFSVAQLQAFQVGFERLIHPTSKRFIYRKPDADEQATREVPATLDATGKVMAAARTEHVIDDAEIERRRESEMSPETAAAYEASKLADDAHMTTFCQQAITEHVWLPKGFTLTVNQDEDDTPVTIRGGQGSGKAIVEALGGNLSFLVRVTHAIHQENTLSSEAKKFLRSLSASTASSPQLEGDGTTPAATATNAEPQGSAKSGNALEGQATAQSGLTPGAS